MRIYLKRIRYKMEHSFLISCYPHNHSFFYIPECHVVDVIFRPSNRNPFIPFTCTQISNLPVTFFSIYFLMEVFLILFYNNKHIHELHLQTLVNAKMGIVLLHTFSFLHTFFYTAKSILYTLACLSSYTTYFHIVLFKGFWKISSKSFLILIPCN